MFQLHLKHERAQLERFNIALIKILFVVMRQIGHTCVLYLCGDCVEYLKRKIHDWNVINYCHPHFSSSKEVESFWRLLMS